MSIGIGRLLPSAACARGPELLKDLPYLPTRDDAELALTFGGPPVVKVGVVLVVAGFSSAAAGVKGGRRPSRQRSRSDP
jgi:hypothetical protein